MTPVALDSNVLVYMANVVRVEEDKAKVAAILSLLARLSGKVRLVAATQALGETFIVMQRSGLSRKEARQGVEDLAAKLDVVTASEEAFHDAMDVAVDHKLQFWDSLILASAAHAGCAMLLSEGMQDGFDWQGVTIANPFAEKPNRKLARILE